MNIKTFRLITQEIKSFQSKNTLSIIPLFAFVFTLFFMEAKAQINFLPVQTNPFSLVDIGSLAAPSFADLDGDGDLDLISGDELGDFRYFENTGTNLLPVFSNIQLNPFALTNIGEHSAPLFLDIDADGDFDLLVPDKAGDFHFFENTGSTSAPLFGAVQLNPFGLSTSQPDARSSFADLDNDGDFDLLHGGRNGDLFYRENIGSATVPNFAAPVTNPFSLTNVGFDSSPALSDLDNDGDFDLLVAERFGDFQYFENIGTAIAPNFSTPLNNPFSLTTVFAVPSPTFADLDNNGSLDLMVGDEFGNFQYFENTNIITGIKNTQNIALTAYPNPTHDFFTITLHQKIQDAQVLISAINGKIVYDSPKIEDTQLVIRTADWESGLYIVKVISADNSAVLKFIKF